MRRGPLKCLVEVSCTWLIESNNGSVDLFLVSLTCFQVFVHGLKSTNETKHRPKFQSMYVVSSFLGDDQNCCLSACFPQQNFRFITPTILISAMIHGQQFLHHFDVKRKQIMSSLPLLCQRVMCFVDLNIYKL